MNYTCETIKWVQTKCKWTVQNNFLYKGTKEELEQFWTVTDENYVKNDVKKLQVWN